MATNPLAEFEGAPALPDPQTVAREDYIGPTEESNWVLPGRLLVGAYPGYPDDEENDAVLASILQLGTTTFVCLQQEYQHTGVTKQQWKSGEKLRPYIFDAVRLLEQMPNHMFHMGKPEALEFVHFPIVDCSTVSDKRVYQLAVDLVDRLMRGENLYVHCWGGHGRTGTVVSLMLGILYGFEAEAAMAWVQMFHDLRLAPMGVPSPQTSSQREQVGRILTRLATRRARPHAVSKSKIANVQQTCKDIEDMNIDKNDEFETAKPPCTLEIEEESDQPYQSEGPQTTRADPKNKTSLGNSILQDETSNALPHAVESTETNTIDQVSNHDSFTLSRQSISHSHTDSSILDTLAQSIEETDEESPISTTRTEDLHKVSFQDSMEPTYLVASPLDDIEQRNIQLDMSLQRSEDINRDRDVHQDQDTDRAQDTNQDQTANQDQDMNQAQALNQSQATNQNQALNQSQATKQNESQKRMLRTVTSITTNPSQEVCMKNTPTYNSDLESLPINQTDIQQSFSSTSQDGFPTVSQGPTSNSSRPIASKVKRSIKPPDTHVPQIQTASMDPELKKQIFSTTSQLASFDSYANSSLPIPSKPQFIASDPTTQKEGSPSASTSMNESIQCTSTTVSNPSTSSNPIPSIHTKPAQFRVIESRKVEAEPTFSNGSNSFTKPKPPTRPKPRQQFTTNQQFTNNSIASSLQDDPKRKSSQRTVKNVNTASRNQSDESHQLYPQDEKRKAVHDTNTLSRNNTMKPKKPAKMKWLQPLKHTLKPIFRRNAHPNGSSRSNSQPLKSHTNALKHMFTKTDRQTLAPIVSGSTGAGPINSTKSGIPKSKETSRHSNRSLIDGSVTTDRNTKKTAQTTRQLNSKASMPPKDDIQNQIKSKCDVNLMIQSQNHSIQPTRPTGPISEKSGRDHIVRGGRTIKTSTINSVPPDRKPHPPSKSNRNGFRMRNGQSKHTKQSQLVDKNDLKVNCVRMTEPI